MARDSFKYVLLHEEYDATAPFFDVPAALKKGKIPEHFNFHNQCEKLEGEEGVDETRKSKRRRVTTSNMLEALEDGSDVIVGSNQWSWLTIDSEPNRFIGLECKVYWPLDNDRYSGRIIGYNPSTDRYHVMPLLSVHIYA
ncbi:hypothetical protein ACET3Z_030546 [Daucus carota]